MTEEADEIDSLPATAREAEAHQCLNSRAAERAETELLGCVYIESTRRSAHAARTHEVSWWV
ncbi:hypothetical protein [Kitasatospora albolonga]|uniref:hypothetical protein n=1 Tax=Kitasatospora albolonga TaxID=68173 RepID=UPI0031EE6358